MYHQGMDQGEAAYLEQCNHEGIVCCAHARDVLLLGLLPLPLPGLVTSALVAAVSIWNARSQFHKNCDLA